MVIQVDTREKKNAIQKILQEFDRQGIEYFMEKLDVADYKNLDNPTVVVDRKQNLNEVANNVCQDHERFRRELIRGQEAGEKVVILIEHNKKGDQNKVESIADVIWWDNPRRHKRKLNDEGYWVEEETNAIEGEKLAKIMATMQKKYGCEWRFCDKEDTGAEIIRILSEGVNDK